MFWKEFVKTLRYNASLHSARALSLKLEEYFRVTYRNSNSILIPKGAHSIRVSNVTRIGGALSQEVYSMTLNYIEGGKTCLRDLVLKAYLENIDPVLEAYVHGEDLRRSEREFQVMRSLWNVGFPVPEVYLCENNSIYLGYPFVIMQKEALVQKTLNELVDCFASTLAQLHNLKLSSLGIAALRYPRNKYSFAERRSIHFRHFLNLETRHKGRYKKDFELAINWLNSNFSKNPCPQYSLVHGDYHPANLHITVDSRAVLLDWESTEIGDPAFDVGYAYHFIKFFSNSKNPQSAEKTAERFISEYMKVFKGDISERLSFYKLVGILGPAIYYSSGISSVTKAYAYHKRQVLPTFPFLGGLLILLGFPFVRQPYVARKLGTEANVLWLRYFENYIEANIKM